jgi:hypothetical protein
MGWRERHGLALRQIPTQYPQNPDRDTPTDSFADIAHTLPGFRSHESAVAEPSTIVPFDEINKIIDGLEAEFLGIKRSARFSCE